jgi:hypothetical protein
LVAGPVTVFTAFRVSLEAVSFKKAVMGFDGHRRVSMAGSNVLQAERVFSSFLAFTLAARLRINIPHDCSLLAAQRVSGEQSAYPLSGRLFPGVAFRFLRDAFSAKQL